MPANGNDKLVVPKLDISSISKSVIISSMPKSYVSVPTMHNNDESIVMDTTRSNQPEYSDEYGLVIGKVNLSSKMAINMRDRNYHRFGDQTKRMVEVSKCENGLKFQPI